MLRPSDFPSHVLTFKIGIPLIILRNKLLHLEIALLGLMAVTNEFRSSQICPYCFRKVERPKRTFLAVGKKSCKLANDGSQCVNPVRPAVNRGSATFGRDNVAALVIGLAGISSITTGNPLLPFNQNISASAEAQ